MNLKRIQLFDKKGEEVSYTDRSPRRSRRETTIFSPECIFCNKIERKKVNLGGAWTTEGTPKFDLGGQHLGEPQFSNPCYRTENLKQKINRAYSDRVGFVALDRDKDKFQTDLVYSRDKYRKCH